MKIPVFIKMKYLHIKNLEKYHPGYKDRHLIWCKAYFNMLNADHEFEMLEEVDKWRFVAFIMLELQLKKDIPLDPDYLNRKGFDLEKRPIALTLKTLHALVEIRNCPGQLSESTSISSDQGCVYFLQEMKKNLIKIGYSKHLNRRVQDLQKQKNRKIKFLYAHLGTIQQEHEYHERFENQMIAPEWFEPIPEIFEFIEKLRQNSEIVDVTEDFGSYNSDVTYFNKNVTHIRVEKNREEKSKKKKVKRKFTPPTKNDVTEYAKEEGYTLDIERFINHYTSNGWKIGKNKMVDWRATVRNWGTKIKIVSLVLKKQPKRPDVSAGDMKKISKNVKDLTQSLADKKDAK